MFKYAGVVVLYNPENGFMDNIKTYINYIDKLYVIDNSELINESLIEKIRKEPKCIYIKLGENKGLAYALNMGCRMAIKDEFDYALTMDQDSYFEESAVKQVEDFIESSVEKYAIVCPNVKSIYFDYIENTGKVAYTLINENDNEIKKWVMTSGSMMNLKDYSDVGGFDDKMFIAHVDIDLCIKINKKSKKIIMLGEAIIYQRFGNSRPKRILWKTVHPSFASPVRTYYLFRNQKYLEKKYGKSINKFMDVHLYKFIIKIVLFEKQKFKKLMLGYKGILDAKKNIMGKYS